MRFLKPEITINGKDYTDYFKGKPIKEGIQYLKENLYVDSGSTLTIESNFIEPITKTLEDNTKNEFFEFNILQALIDENILDLNQDWKVKFSFTDENWVMTKESNYFINLFDLKCDCGHPVYIRVSKQDNYAERTYEQGKGYTITVPIDSMLNETVREATVTVEYTASTKMCTCTFSQVSGKDKIITADLTDWFAENSINVELLGDLVNEGSKVSGFTSTSYVVLPELFNPQDSPWELHMGFNVPVFNNNLRLFTDHLNIPGICLGISGSKLCLWASSNGSSWNIANGVAGKTTLTVNTDYEIDLKFDGTKYTVNLIKGKTTTEEISVTSNLHILENTAPTVMGIYGGTTTYNFILDLAKCYLIQDSSRIFSFLTDNTTTYNASNTNIYGNLTVSNVGIANNFSENGYVHIHNNGFSTGTLWEVYGSYQTESDISRRQTILNCDSLYNDLFVLYLQNSKVYCEYKKNHHTELIGTLNPNITLKTNTKYYYKAKIMNNTLRIGIGESQDSLIEEFCEDFIGGDLNVCLLGIDQQVTQWILYKDGILQHPFSGTMDLKDFSIRKDKEIIWKGLKEDLIELEKLYIGCKSEYKEPSANCYIAGHLKEEHGKLSDFQTYSWAGIDPWDEGENDWEFVIGCDLHTTGNNTLIGNTTNAANGGGFMLTTTSNELIFNGTNNASSWTKATFNTGLYCTEDPHWIKIKRASGEDEEYRTRMLQILTEYQTVLEEGTFDVAFGYAPAFTVMYCNKATYYRIKKFTNEEHQSQVQEEIDTLTKEIDPLTKELGTLNVEGLFTWDNSYIISHYELLEGQELTEDQTRAIELCGQLHDLTTQKQEKTDFLTFIKQSNFFMFLESTDNQTYPNYNTVALMKTGIQELHPHDTINTIEVTTAANYDNLLKDDTNNTLLKTHAYKYSFHWATFNEPDVWYDGAYFYSGNNMKPYTQQMRFGLTNRSNPWQGNIYLEKAYLKIGEEIVWKGLRDVDEYNTEITANLDKHPTLANSCFQVNGTTMTGFAAVVYGIIPTVRTPLKSMEWMLHYHSPKTAVAYSLLDHHGSYKGLIIRIPSSGIIQCWLSNTGSSWNVMNDKRSTLKIPFDTDVSMRITWNGSTYNIDVKTEEQDEWINYITLDSTLGINYETYNGQGFGGGDDSNYFNGGIYYLEDCYLDIDGKRVWSGISYTRDYGTEEPQLIIKDVETTGNVVQEYVTHKNTVPPPLVDEKAEIEKIKNNLISYLQEKDLYVSDDGNDIDPTYQWASTEQFNQVFDGKSLEEIQQIDFDDLQWDLNYGTLNCNVSLYGTTKLRTGMLTTMSRNNGAELPFIFDVTEGQTWEAVFRAMCITYYYTNNVIIGNGKSNTSYNNFAVQLGGARWLLWMSTRMNEENVVNGVIGENPITEYEFRFIRVRYDGWNYYWDWSFDGKHWIRDYCVELQHEPLAIDPFPLTLGDEYDSTRACDAIDLQNCYFKINDKYIWKGCPDKDKNNTKLYIHNDVILEDNKIRNFSNENYIRMFIPQEINTYKIEADFHVPEIAYGVGYVFGSSYEDIRTPKLYLYGDRMYFGFPLENFTWVTGDMISFPFKVDTDYHVEMIYDGSTYKINVREGEEDLESQTGEMLSSGWIQDLIIGLHCNAEPYFTNTDKQYEGYIYLDKFKVYINDELYCNGQDLIDYSNKYDAQILGKITRNNNFFVNSQHGYWNAIGVSNDLFYERGSQHICKEKYDRNAINLPETVEELIEYIKTENTLGEPTLFGRYNPEDETIISTQWENAKNILNENSVISTAYVMPYFDEDTSGKVIKDFVYCVWPDETETEQIATTGTFCIYMHYIEESEERENIEQKWLKYITEQDLFISEDGTDVDETKQWIPKGDWDYYFTYTDIITLQTNKPEEYPWTLYQGTQINEEARNALKEQIEAWFTENGYKISVDGEDVSDTEQYVTPEQIDSYMEQDWLSLQNYQEYPWYYEYGKLPSGGGVDLIPTGVKVIPNQVFRYDENILDPKYDYYNENNEVNFITVQDLLDETEHNGIPINNYDEDYYEDFEEHYTTIINNLVDDDSISTLFMTKEQAKDKDYVTRQIIKYLRYSKISNVQGILGQVYDIQIPPEQFVTEFEPLLLDDEGEYLMSWYIKVTTSDGIFTIIFGNCYDYRKH